jgi:hypothetical protein
MQCEITRSQWRTPNAGVNRNTDVVRRHFEQMEAGANCSSEFVIRSRACTGRAQLTTRFARSELKMRSVRNSLFARQFFPISNRPATTIGSGIF